MRTVSPDYDLNHDDEALWAWDIEARDPILASMHVEGVLLPGDEDQPDYLMDVAQSLLMEAVALGDADAIAEAWSLVDAAA